MSGQTTTILEGATFVVSDLSGTRCVPNGDPGAL